MRTLESPACSILLGDVRAGAAAAASVAPFGAERPLDSPSPDGARGAVTGARTAGGRGGAAVPLHVRTGWRRACGADRATFTPGELPGNGSRAARRRVDNARLYPTRRRAEELGAAPRGRPLPRDARHRAGARRRREEPRAHRRLPRGVLALGAADGVGLEIRAVAGPLRDLPRAAVDPPPEHAHRRAGARSARADRRRGRGERPARPAGGARSPGARGRSRSRSSCATGPSASVDHRRDPRPAPLHPRRGAARRGVANQLAVAVENARLYEDLRRSYAELARAQRQLIQQERLAALGELSAVVAHEVRNPLGVIFNSLGSLRRLLRPDRRRARCCSTSSARRRTG